MIILVLQSILKKTLRSKSYYQDGCLPFYKSLPPFKNKMSINCSYVLFLLCFSSKHVCTCAGVCLRACAHAHACTCACASVSGCGCAYVYVCAVYVCACACVCTCMRVQVLFLSWESDYSQYWFVLMYIFSRRHDWVQMRCWHLISSKRRKSIFQTHDYLLCEGNTE